MMYWKLTFQLFEEIDNVFATNIEEKLDGLMGVSLHLGQLAPLSTRTIKVYRLSGKFRIVITITISSESYVCNISRRLY